MRARCCSDWERRPQRRSALRNRRRRGLRHDLSALLRALLAHLLELRLELLALRRREDLHHLLAYRPHRIGIGSASRRMALVILIDERLNLLILVGREIQTLENPHEAASTRSRLSVDRAAGWGWRHLCLGEHRSDEQERQRDAARKSQECHGATIPAPDGALLERRMKIEALYAGGRIATAFTASLA